MGKKDYEKLAYALGTGARDGGVLTVLCQVLKHDNPNFNEHYFLLSVAHYADKGHGVPKNH